MNTNLYQLLQPQTERPTFAGRLDSLLFVRFYHLLEGIIVRNPSLDYLNVALYD